MVKYARTAKTLDRTLSAIADPNRRRILERLERGPASVSDLADPLDISLPGLLKHVRILEEASLVTTHKQGRVRWCRLGPSRMDDAHRWIERRRKQWSRRLDRFESYVTWKKGDDDEP